MAVEAKLLSEVQAWIADDPEPVDRAELEELIEAGDSDGLRARFSGPLRFGTAGLRGPIGAGPSRMNRATVARATAGLCAELQRSVPEANSRGLCIGFDARHRSREFAEEAAAIAAGAGMQVHLFETPVPTPVLAFALLESAAAGGVMVTASHNPKDDNGFKVYWHDGAQIIPPIDSAIAAAIDAVASVSALPRLDADARRDKGLQHNLGAAMESDYLRAVAGLLDGEATPDPKALVIAYTAMHGVGHRFVDAALADAGFSQVHTVTAQAQPDPEFPTVVFPNPEEDGAMDAVLALGQAVGADLVLANDPDADRLAAAARDLDGKLTPLTGNELGALLADDLLRRFAARSDAAGDGVTGLVLNSIVSTPLVAKIARAHGAHHEDTLTGFKWICARAIELERTRAMRFVFGFEEALGYAAGTRVRDKDGVSMAVLTARMAAQAKQRGETLHGRLRALWNEHGVHLSRQISLRLAGSDGQARRGQLMAALREQPPAEFGGLAITRTRDLAAADSGLPPSDAIFFDLAGGQRVAVRPSGTEPKLKLYLDVCQEVQDGAVEAAVQQAHLQLDALAAALRDWVEQV